MASHPVGSSSTGTDFIEILSCVRGVHTYKDVWEPRAGEVLLLQREPDNGEDKLAVAVLKSGRVVGHAPKNLAPVFHHFCDTVVIKQLSKLRERESTVGLAMVLKHLVFTACLAQMPSSSV